MSGNTLMDLRELEKERDKYASRVPKLALYVAVIFAAPAAIALLLFKFLDIPIVFTLPFAFINSWGLVIRLYKKVDREAQALDKQIAEAKQREQDQAADK